ncbi:MAG: alanine racemase [Thermoleophilaceae bacterium]
MGHPPERAVARVDLGAVERNCRALAGRLTGGAELCAVVKADAYGHGDTWCARAAQAGGAAWLAVATAGEAAELRRHGISGRILVMGALTREDARTALDAGADVVAWHAGFVRDLADAAGREPGVRAPVHVKLDTGMGRLGTADPDEAREVATLVEADERLELAGLMTHFATADERGDDHFAAQLGRFTAFAGDMRARHRDLRVHAANSAAALRDPAAHFDMVRCGVAVYGLDPFGEDPAEQGLEPALSLESYVAAVKRFEPGESAGYGRRWRASEPTWVGVLPIGYGDGWRRALGNNADVLVGGARRPLVGTVSMDNIAIDLGPDTDVEPGEPAVLIGAQGGERILAEEVARRLDTINYEITCGLLPRVRRHYVHP